MRYIYLSAFDDQWHRNYVEFYSTTLLEPYRNSSRSDVRQGAILETVRKQRA